MDAGLLLPQKWFRSLLQLSNYSWTWS
jgi:hypothetical protein